MDRFGRLFGRFNIWFDRTTGRYQGVVGRLLSAPLRWLAVFAAMLVITLFLFTRIPGGFLPIEDQGTVLPAVQAPPGAPRASNEEAVAPVTYSYREERKSVGSGKSVSVRVYTGVDRFIKTIE